MPCGVFLLSTLRGKTMLGTHIFKVQKLGRRTKREKLIITLYDPLDFRKYIDKYDHYYSRTLLLRPTLPLVADLSVELSIDGLRNSIVIAEININVLWTEIEQFLTHLKTENIIYKHEYNRQCRQGIIQ